MRPIAHWRIFRIFAAAKILRTGFGTFIFYGAKIHTFVATVGKGLLLTFAAGTPPITDSTMTNAPSAELAPDQKDEDNLPPYTVLDSILEDWIERGIRNDSPLTESILSRLHANEHKRWQLCPAPRVSNRAFGQGWRQPLASRR